MKRTRTRGDANKKSRRRRSPRLRVAGRPGVTRPASMVAVSASRRTIGGGCTPSAGSGCGGVGTTSHKDGRPRDRAGPAAAAMRVVPCPP
jgi:hypothetical protein